MPPCELLNALTRSLTWHRGIQGRCACPLASLRSPRSQASPCQRPTLRQPQRGPLLLGRSLVSGVGRVLREVSGEDDELMSCLRGDREQERRAPRRKPKIPRRRLPPNFFNALGSGCEESQGRIQALVGCTGFEGSKEAGGFLPEPTKFLRRSRRNGFLPSDRRECGEKEWAQKKASVRGKIKRKRSLSASCA